MITNLRLMRLFTRPVIRELTKCRAFSQQTFSRSSVAFVQRVQCDLKKKIIQNSKCSGTTSISHMVSNSNKMDSKQLQKILNEFSTEKYFIEYGGFLSNHLSHGIIAFQRLGASEERIRKFIDWYVSRLESSDGHSAEWKIPGEEISGLTENNKLLELNKETYNKEKIMGLIGRRCSYYAILQFYEQQLQEYSRDVDKLIRQWFPVVVPGFAGSALHGLIHLGYGYAAGNTRMLLEGLAYMHHSYTPFNSTESFHNSHQFLQSLGRGSETITEVLSQITANVELRNYISAGIKQPEYQSMDTSDFQRSMRIIFAHKADVILDYVCRIKFPEHIDIALPTEQEKQNLFKWLLDCAITVYALCERKNDFFLIHGVTAAFSMRQVITPFNVTDPGDKVAILKCTTAYLYTLLSAYITQGAHKLVPFEAGTVGRLEKSSWSDIVAECLSLERDEHVYKLVQICHELDKETTDINLNNIYKRAASRALEHQLIF